MNKKKLRKAENRISTLNDVVDELMKENSELADIITKHHDVGVVHADCGQEAIARAWGRICEVCSKQDHLAVLHGDTGETHGMYRGERGRRRP